MRRVLILQRIEYQYSHASINFMGGMLTSMQELLSIDFMLQENARMKKQEIVLQVTLAEAWYLLNAVPHRILQKSLKMIMELLLASFRLRNLLKVSFELPHGLRTEIRKIMQTAHLSFQTQVLFRQA